MSYLMRKLTDITKSEEMRDRSWFHWRFRYAGIEFDASFFPERHELHISELNVPETQQAWLHVFPVEHRDYGVTVNPTYLGDDYETFSALITTKGRLAEHESARPNDLLRAADADAQVCTTGTTSVPDILPWSMLRHLEDPDKTYFVAWVKLPEGRNVTKENAEKTALLTRSKEYARRCKLDGRSSRWSANPDDAHEITPPWE